MKKLVPEAVVWRQENVHRDCPHPWTPFWAAVGGILLSGLMAGHMAYRAGKSAGAEYERSKHNEKSSVHHLLDRNASRNSYRRGWDDGFMAGHFNLKLSAWDTMPEELR